MATAIMFGAFLLLMLVGIPVGISMGVGAVIGMLIAGIPLDVLPRIMISGVDSFALLAVPFFILAGNLMNTSGITVRIFDFAREAVGWMRGGLAQVNIAASMIFAGVSGAALADLAGLGAVEMRAMREAGYPRQFSAAITLASCTIGPIIPPSIVLVLYGLATNTSVGRLFLAGILPGLFIGLCLMVFVALIIRFSKSEWPGSERFSGKRFIAAGQHGFLALLSPVVILAALVFGVSTPTELGAIMCAYAVVVGLIYRELGFEGLRKSIVSTTTTTAIIMYLIAVGSAMGWVITSERSAHYLADMVVSVSDNPIIALLAINVLLLFVGMFLETPPAILILSTILMPLVTELGIDPVHFGVIVCFNLLIGIMTPPVGIGIYVAAHVAGVPSEKVMKASLPLFVPLLFALGVVTLVPGLSLWLPNLVFN